MKILKALLSTLLPFCLFSQVPDSFYIENLRVVESQDDSVCILWYTSSPTANNKVVYGLSTPPSETAIESAHKEIASKFHTVKIGGLENKRKYYFYIESDGKIDDNDGTYYTFTSPTDHHDIYADAYITSDLSGTWFLTFQFKDSNSFIDFRDTTLRSLETRFYLRATEYQMRNVTAELANFGYGKFEHYYNTLRNVFQEIKPVKVDDSYDPNDHTYSWSFSLPIGEAHYQFYRSGGGNYCPIDITINNMDMKELPNGNHWSFREHKTSDGDHMDFPGISTPDRKTVISNPYVTLIKDDEIIWGQSPDDLYAKRHLDLSISTTITSPLSNPPDQRHQMISEEEMIQLTGWAKVTLDGKIDDIWVNGVSVTPLSDAVWYDQTKDVFNFNLNSAVKYGPNHFDITFFAAPSSDCMNCTGSSYSNHSFIIDVLKSDFHLSQMLITNNGLQIESDVITPDTSSHFTIKINDKNRDQDKNRIDSLFVEITTSRGDKYLNLLIEDSISSGNFTSAETFSFVSDPSLMTANDYFVEHLDYVTIRYEDPTAPSDTQSVTLIVQDRPQRPSIPLIPISGLIFDTDGNGKADRVVIDYSNTIDEAGDSVMIPFPSPQSRVVYDKTRFEIMGSRVFITDHTAFPQNATSFAGVEKTQGILWTASDDTPNTFDILEKIGPVLTEALFYETQHTDRDSMCIRLSEEVFYEDSTADSMILIRDGEEIILSITDVRKTADTEITLRIAGSVRPQPGDSLRLCSSEFISDTYGNTPHPQNRPVAITIVPGPPFISSGTYHDGNGDGIIDRLMLRFTKPVITDSLEKLICEWQSESFLIPKQNLEKTADSVIIADLSGLIKSRSTNGSMKISAKFHGHEASSPHVISDNAAPVILSAVYIPHTTKSAGGEASGDQLKIEFSEPVNINQIIYPKPFNTLRRDSVNYVFQIARSGARNIGNTVIFKVNEIDLYPQTGDLINISVTGGIYDTCGNVQDNPQNTFASLVSQPFTVTFNAGPNPFTPGISEVPAVPGLTITSGTSIVANFNGNLGMWSSDIDAKISIYDNVGNLVCETKNKQDLHSQVQYSMFQLNPSKLIFLWDGYSRNNRKVGCGAYLAVVTVTDPSGNSVTERITLGVRSE